MDLDDSHVNKDILESVISKDNLNDNKKNSKQHLHRRGISEMNQPLMLGMNSSNLISHPYNKAKSILTPNNRDTSLDNFSDTKTAGFNNQGVLYMDNISSKKNFGSKSKTPLRDKSYTKISTNSPVNGKNKKVVLC